MVRFSASRLIVPPVSVVIGASVLLLTYACSSSTPKSADPPDDAGVNQCAPPDSSAGNATINASAATCAAPGEPTAGPADTHCVVDGGSLGIQSTSPSACCVPGDAGGPDQCPYNATMFGHEGDDDDCKYHVTWSSTPICEGSGGVEFTVVATYLGTSNPVTGAHIHPEIFTTTPGDAACDDMSSHESPSNFEVFGESPPGTYMGRVVFDKPGQWTLRYHLNENCLDVLPDSPHGHAAFHLTVP